MPEDVRIDSSLNVRQLGEFVQYPLYSERTDRPVVPEEELSIRVMWSRMQEIEIRLQGAERFDQGETSWTRLATSDCDQNFVRVDS